MTASGRWSSSCPLPPGTFVTLWNADDRFRQAYFSRYPGYYETGDAGYIDDNGYVFVMSRTDDVINVAGHRLSTGAMEEVLAAHPDVAECAVIGVADALKGQLPLGLLVLSDGVDRDPAQVTDEVVAAVREQIGPVAAFRAVTSSSACPRPARERSSGHDAQYRRRPGLQGAGNHRRPGNPQRDRGAAGSGGCGLNHAADLLTRACNKSVTQGPYGRATSR
jgi:hypothetical protein